MTDPGPGQQPRGPSSTTQTASRGVSGAEDRAAPRRRSRRAGVGWLLVLVLVAALAAWFWVSHMGKRAGGAAGGRGGRGGAASARNMPTTVSVATIARGDIPITLDELGTVTPVQNVVVRTQISGQLLSVGFREGQMVSRGQFLAQVDPRPYQATLQQAQGGLMRDQAQLANARLDLSRYQTLLREDSIAGQQVDTTAALVRQLTGTIATDQAAITAAKVNLAYTHIVSPVTGRVGLRQVDPGNFVTTGDANGIVVVTQINPMDVLFTLPQDNLPAVAARVRQGATLAATAYDRARVNALAKGRLLTLDNVIDTSTGTIRAKARFDNGDGALFPDQFVNVRLLVDTLQNAVTAPSSAVLRGSQGMFVYVVDPPTRKVSVRNVKTGPSSGDLVAVTGGLNGGEMVVTDGSDRLREGACVILPGDRIPNFGAGGRGGRGRHGGGGTGGFGGGQGGAGGGQGGAGGPGGGSCPNAGKPVVAQTGGGGPFARGAEAGDAAAAGGAGAQARGPDRQPGPVPGGDGAQQGGAEPGGGQGGGGAGRMVAALGLDAKQAAQAQAIFARHQPSDPEDPDSRREARQAAMAELTPILRPDQRAKLDAFRAQMRARGGQGGGGQGGGDPSP